MKTKDLYILALGLLYGALMLTLLMLGVNKSIYNNLSVTLLLCTLTASIVLMHYVKHLDNDEIKRDKNEQQ
jgi:hypothetical protein